VGVGVGVAGVGVTDGVMEVVGVIEGVGRGVDGIKHE
jgi:hypothetical protein